MFIYCHADYAEEQIIIDLVSKFAPSRNLRAKNSFPRYLFIYYHADYAKQQIIKDLVSK